VRINIRGGSPGRERQTKVGLSRTAFLRFRWLFYSDALEMKPALLYGHMRLFSDLE